MLRDERRTGQIGVGETEDKELIWVGNHDLVIVGNFGEEVVVIGDPQGVERGFALIHVGTEGEAFQLGRNLVCADAVSGQHLDDIQEGQRTLRYGMSCRGGSIHVCYIDSAVQVNLEDLLYDSNAAIAAAGAIAFVNQELVLV